jgi:hypothetical protein
MDKSTLPQPIKVDMGSVIVPIHNRRDGRSIARKMRQKPDLPRQRKCGGPSKPLPAQINHYATLTRKRKAEALVARLRTKTKTASAAMKAMGASAEQATYALNEMGRALGEGIKRGVVSRGQG